LENGAFKRIYAKIKTDVNEGSSLANAYEKHKCFDHIFVNMVRAGESSGALDIVLERLADFKESQAELKGQILGTMLYPLIMILVGSGLVGVLFTVVVPRITRIFEHAKAQLPLMTRILIWTSETMRDYWYLIILAIVTTIFLTQRWLQTKKGRAAWDRISLRLPLFGTLFRMIAVARFSRTLGTLLSSGVSLLVALDIVRNVVSNDVMARAIDNTRDAIKEGEEIAPPLKRSKQFPPMVIHMIAIGEKSGQLENMLNRIATAFEKRVELRLKALTSLLEPIMILGMGLGVGFIVFSILKPILEMNTLIK
jgi:general secretion pathway protein F